MPHDGLLISTRSISRGRESGGRYGAWLGLLAAEMIPVGFLVGSTLFGLNMLITCLCLRMNRNDAFSSLRIGSYNNFLRQRLAEDGFDVFAIGLEEVPGREDWIANPMHKPGHPDPDQPVCSEGRSRTSSHREG